MTQADQAADLVAERLAEFDKQQAVPLEQRTQAIPYRDLVFWDAVRTVLAERAGRRLMMPNSEGEAFEVGKFYISANDAFVFECQEIVGGIALGRELNVSRWPCLASHHVYARERVEGCHREITAEEVYRRFGRAGWNPPAGADSAEPHQEGDGAA